MNFNGGGGTTESAVFWRPGRQGTAQTFAGKLVNNHSGKYLVLQTLN